MSFIGSTLHRILGDERYFALCKYAAERKTYRKYAPEFKNTPSPRNVLLCCPEHCNIGDHAIAYAERRLLASLDKPFLSFCGDMSTLLPCLRRFVTPQDTIFLHGGGNMGTLYRQEEQYRCDIISMFPENNIILFPQTISYDDTADSQQYLRYTQNVYSGHRKLHLIARETVSYERMRQYYPDNDVLITPDIVLSLTDQATADFTQRDGILLCMRNDVEKSTTGEAQQSIEAAARATGQYVGYTDTTVPNSFFPISEEHGEELVLGKFDEFRKARLIVTDRLHGMIFSAVTGTPCIAMNNANGKVGFEYQWLKDFPYIRFAENADEVIAMIPDMVQETHGAERASELLTGLQQSFQPLNDLL